MSASNSLPIDHPITSSDQDVLGRAVVARDFARSVRDLDSSQGVVVGVLGAWGHGKSSFVNLMREEFAEAPELAVVEFNPWVFSGDQQLTDVFFREIAAELRLKDHTKFGAIAEGLDKYGDVLSPLAVIPWFGSWFDRAFKATKAATTWWNDRKKGSRTFRETVSDALKKLDKPVVVVIDDIDRLTTNEIRDIFRLVRLTASFPNVIYVLAFDRRRVEQALSEDGVPGRAYLEKILQLSFDVPMIPTEVLRTQVFERLDAVLQDVEGLRFSEAIWPDVYAEIIDPLISSLRDVTRLGLSARPTLRALGQQIEAVDLLALEAVRVFRPEIFQALHASRLALTETQSLWGRTQDPMRKAEIDELLKAADKDDGLVRALIKQLFPAARSYIENNSYGPDWIDTWKREHRVAYIGYLDLYFGRTLPSDLASFQHAERAYDRITDSEALGEYLDSLPKPDLESVIAGLEVFQRDYPEAAVVPASVTLLNRISEMPERRNRGMFDIMRADVVVTRVVIRLLQRLDDEAAREDAVREIVAGVRSYSSQELLIRSVGRVEDPSNALISVEATAQLDEDLAARVKATPPPEPEKEWGLFRVWWFVAGRDGDEYSAPGLTDAAEVRALIQSARSVSRAQFIGSRHVREEDRLAWEGLVRVVGGETKLTEAIRRLRSSDGDSPLVLLAEKYAAGWRPDDS
ncbi:KAP family P-loop NTPase fold protein [Microbacterium telephonicum]|uniref:Putative KAP-like P-loop ATPase n=1 Tax=Microbacterium telephonicum TaxID=1714841 RepID=A0A498CC29_9MICO|nr:P-loop NTPase fold protein [Microbacterium telephonicum]RLK52727.1 putative KAP-like P-loop ATPase [Microbacterium telephonicum]